MPERITHAQEDWDDRGHIPAHDIPSIQSYLLHLMTMRGAARRREGLGSRRRVQRLERQIQVLDGLGVRDARQRLQHLTV